VLAPHTQVTLCIRAANRDPAAVPRSRRADIAPPSEPSRRVRAPASTNAVGMGSAGSKGVSRSGASGALSGTFPDRSGAALTARAFFRGTSRCRARALADLARAEDHDDQTLIEGDPLE